MIDGISGSGGSSLRGLISNLQDLRPNELEALGLGQSEVDTLLTILTKILNALSDGFQIEDLDVLKDCLDELECTGFSSPEILQTLRETLKEIEEFIEEMIEKGVSVDQINKLLDGKFDLADHLDEEFQVGIVGSGGEELGSELALTNEAEKMAALLQMRQKLQNVDDKSGAVLHNLIEKGNQKSIEKHQSIEKLEDTQADHIFSKDKQTAAYQRFSKLERNFVEQLTTMITNQSVDKLLDNSNINKLLDEFDIG